MPNVPEFLDFASLWSFVPKHRWRDDASIVQSQKQKLKNALLYRDAIKRYTTFSGDNVPSVYDQAAKECVSESKLNDFFDKNMLLVPVPRSKLNKPDTLWPSKLIAESLIRVGIGSGWLRAYLERLRFTHRIKEMLVKD